MSDLILSKQRSDVNGSSVERPPNPKGASSVPVKTTSPSFAASSLALYRAAREVLAKRPACTPEEHRLESRIRDFEREITGAAFEIDDGLFAGTSDMGAGDVVAEIDTCLWLAESYFRQGSDGMGRECLLEAWSEYSRFREVIDVYDSDQGDKASRLGERVRAMMSEHDLFERVTAGIDTETVEVPA